MRPCLPVVALVLAAACTPGPRRPDPIPRGDYGFAAEYLQWRIEELMEDEALPGVAVALIDDQEVVWQQAFGSTRAVGGEDVTLHTVWRVGSITKLLTAFEVMRLEDEGLVDLDAPLTTYLPDFEVRSWEPDPEPITLRSMLAHRSGLPRNSGLPPWYFDPAGDVMQAQAEELGLFYAAHPPGYRYHYSNAAFNVLAAVVEQRRGAMWVPYARDAFLEPVGMRDSALLREWLDQDAVVAEGHQWDDGEVTRIEQGDIIELGSGNLYASMSDLAAMVSFVLRDGDPLMEPGTMSSMFEVQYASPRDPKPMGLAWFTTDARFGERMVHHTGTNQGTETMLAVLPESGLGVVVVSNSTRFADLYGELVIEALDIALETKTGRKTTELEDGERIDLDSETLESFAGTYVCDDSPVEVYRAGGKLKANMSGTTFRLLPIGPRTFRIGHLLADPGHMEASFFVGDAKEEDLMIVAVEELDHIYCPRYPDVAAAPALWSDIAGRYRVVPRVTSEYSDATDFGTVTVEIEEGPRLRFGRFLVWPEDPERLRIVGGQWDGETLLRDAETGEVVFQYELDLPVAR